MNGLGFRGSRDKMSNLHLKTALILALIVLFSTACASPTILTQAPGTPGVGFTQTAPNLIGSNPISPGPAIPTMSPVGQGEQDPERIFPTLPEGIERIEGTTTTPITGEVPSDMLSSITADLASRLGIEIQKIELVRAESVIWPDGSLGCPNPGDVYTQEPVNGYWIILQVIETQYDYRASSQGLFTLCETPFPLSPPGSLDQ